MIITRIWDYRLLPYLPDAQFKGQFREIVAVMRAWRDTGKTNHLLINKVMEYPKGELASYFWIYREEYFKRYNKTIFDITDEFFEFAKDEPFTRSPFKGWHNKEYLRICMSNLFEKHRGIGKSHITDEEWARLCEGYEQITGEVYEI